MNKLIFSLVVLFSAHANARFYCLPPAGSSYPTLSFESVDGDLDQPVLVDVKFELTHVMGSSFAQIKGKKVSGKEAWSFDVSTLGMYDKSSIEIPQDYLFTDLVGEPGLPASISVEMSGRPAQVTPVLCSFLSL